MRAPLRVLLLLAGCLVPAAGASAAPVQGEAPPPPLPLLPSTNWWNLDVSAAPVDPDSDAYIAFIGPTRRMHPDFGGVADPAATESYGMPYAVVDGNQPKLAVEFFYEDESDGWDPGSGMSVPFYPVPDEAITLPYWVEGGPPGSVDLRADSDRHLLILDRSNRHLYELYNVWHDGTRWHAGSGAFFDLDTNDRRPEGWTSADAAGLAILPGLVRWDEVHGPGEIRHAFRCTVRATNGHVWPASHRAGSTAGALPMGARLRLRASTDLTPYPPELQKVFRAMKTYGLIVADNGSDMYVTGTFDVRWDNDVLNPAFHALHASDFEVVQLGWNPPPPQRALLRSTAVTSLSPITPPLSTLLPLDPVADRHVPDVATGDTDPEAVLRDGRVLVLYALDGPETLRLEKAGGTVRVLF